MTQKSILTVLIYQTIRIFLLQKGLVKDVCDFPCLGCARGPLHDPEEVVPDDLRGCWVHLPWLRSRSEWQGALSLSALILVKFRWTWPNQFLEWMDLVEGNNPNCPNVTTDRIKLQEEVGSFLKIFCHLLLTHG